MENQVVLVAGNNPDINELVQMVLETQLGVLVATTSAGRCAFRSALALQPDLLILDVAPPESASVDFVRELKTSPSTENIPIVALAYEGRAALAEAGCDDVLDKSLDLGLFVTTVHRRLARSELAGRLC